MKRDDVPMWQDPSEPAYVRELLDVGRRAEVDYDVSQGLSQHLAHVKTGTPLPDWAQSGGGGFGTSGGSLVTWVAVPVLTATIAVGVWLGTRGESASRPSVVSQPSAPALEVAAPGQEPLPTAQAPAAATSGTREAAGGAAAASPSEAPRSASEKVARAAQRLAKREGTSHGAKPIETSTGKLEARTGKTPSFAEASHPGAAPAAVASSSENSPSPSPSPSAARGEPSSKPAAAEPAPAEEASALEEKQVASKSEVVRSPEDESRLEREMQMLAVAQRVLRDDPERALRLSRQGEKEFPGSMFSAERQQVALLALVKLGRLDEARRTGVPFLARYPNAPWSERLRRALATGRVE